MLRLASLLHARLPAFRRTVAHTEALLADALARGVAWQVSFSGGKDSTVVLDMVHRLAPQTPVVWFDDEWDYPETLQFLRETEQRYTLPLIRVTYEKYDTDMFWAQEMLYGGKDPIYDHPSDITYREWRRTCVGSMIGVRAEESTSRRIMLRKHGQLFYAQTDQQWRCYPLAWWTWQDVWAYLFSRDLPYNPVYDILATLQVPLKYRRVGPLTAYMVWQYGTLVVLKRGWPDLYRRFVAHFPGASSYA